jgi:hypothetical protein
VYEADKEKDQQEGDREREEREGREKQPQLLRLEQAVSLPTMKWWTINSILHF